MQLVESVLRLCVRDQLLKADNGVMICKYLEGQFESSIQYFVITCIIYQLKSKYLDNIILSIALRNLLQAAVVGKYATRLACFSAQ